MRCFFMKGGHIVDVELLPPDITDEEALEMGRHLFAERQASFDGFEIWDRTRAVSRFPESENPAREDGIPALA